MRRRFVAAAWIAGATVPLLLATVYMVGCCVLPFHGVMHKLMPVCSMVMNAMGGHDDEQPPMPAREKQEPVKRIAVTLSGVTRVQSVSALPVRAPLLSPTAHRSSISLGALRCDQDVGWYVLVAAFLI